MKVGTFNRRRCLSALALPFATPMVSVASTPRRESWKSRCRSTQERLANYLWNCQGDDGAWRSPIYGVLKSGQSLTPFVLHALLQTDSSAARRPATKMAIQWMQSQLRNGSLGFADPDVLDYPVYSTSFALRCFLRYADHTPTQPLIHSISEMAAYLTKEQFTESRGFNTDDLAYGGWGFGGRHPPGQTGHMDLAHTRFALAALQQWKPAPRKKAEALLSLLQKSALESRRQPIGNGELSVKPAFDGGFYFSPIVLRANKGRIDRGDDHAFFRSYATATCDGLLALMALGLPETDNRIQAAKQWLRDHPSWDYPEGIPKDFPEPWGEAVFFYHQAVRAEVYRRLNFKAPWQSDLVHRIDSRIVDDHLINHRSPLMKENDPILCTALGLMAINEVAQS